MGVLFLYIWFSDRAILRHGTGAAALRVGGARRVYPGSSGFYCEFFGWAHHLPAALAVCMESLQDMSR
jgi:hypothetical protein